ncbi:tyrosine-type recombinase/integrase [Candidatus Woesearchaeota archaeon]|nr:tyrosine-type recombinase/integrase [Candidatus Woesearchaeota archaeon]
MTRTKIPKAVRLPNVFTKEQLLELFDNIEEADVMLAVILGGFCGLRIGEVCKLRKENIDFGRKQLKVVNGKLPGKTLAGHGKDRVVPIIEKIIPLLKMWCEIKKGDYLFESLSLADQPITQQHLYKKYKITMKRTKFYSIEKKNKKGHSLSRYNFHTLRHTYATMLWEKTGDIYAVKQALGHNDLETTMIYTHTSDRALQQKVNNAFDITSKNSIHINHKLPKETENPVEILKIRLAKGEIDPEKYVYLINKLIEV